MTLSAELSGQNGCHDGVTYLPLNCHAVNSIKTLVVANASETSRTPKVIFKRVIDSADFTDTFDTGNFSDST